MRYEFSYFDLWPYIIISLVFVIVKYCNYKNSSLYIFIVLFLFCSLRFDVGWDYTSYLDDIKAGPTYILNSRYEFLSKLILLLGSITNFYPIVFILFSFFTLLVVHILVQRNSINPSISWLVFYSMPLFYFASLSTIRQSLATVLLLFSYDYFKNNKNFKGILVTLCAFLFHSSALFGLFFIPILYFRFSKIILWVIFLSSFFISGIIQSQLLNLSGESDLIIRFVNSYLANDLPKSTTLPILYYCIIIFSLLFFNKLIELNVSNEKYITVTVFGIFFFNIFSFEPVTSMRISAFFLIFWVYLLPYFGFIFSEKYSFIFDWLLFLLLLALSFFYLYMYVVSYQNYVLEKVSFLPYKFWIFHLWE